MRITSLFPKSRAASRDAPASESEEAIAAGAT
jgi:hypothetical protein